MPTHSLSTAPVDAETWSRQSKQSAEYFCPPETYEDIHYKCWSCGTSAVFTASQQKQAFEVRKAYIWQRRNLCESCFSKRLAMEREVKDLQVRWKSTKAQLAGNVQALQRWSWLLEQLPTLGAKRNTAHLAMLARLLRDVA